MNDIQKKLWSMLLAMLLLSTMATAAVAEDSQDVYANYAVKAVLPENQRDSGTSAFDILVKPGQKQTLDVIIKNLGDDPIEVAVEANTAYTNSNGLIEFDKHDDYDPSMVVNFEDIVKPVESVIAVPAKGQAMAEFTVAIPDEPFEGVVYGGFMFTKLGQAGGENNEGSMGVQNVFRYLITARIRENEDEIAPAFEFTGAEIDAENRSAMFVNVRNPRPFIARNVQLKVDVYPQEGGEAVFSGTYENISIAPYSVMGYRIDSEELKALEAGQAYKLAVELSYKDKTYPFEGVLSVK